MTEIQNILNAAEEICRDNRQGALATLVSISGSSYRRPGARMLIGSDGTWTGAISGGCLEGDVLLRAQQIVRSGLPELIRYDTTNDDANIFGVGLGCNGIVDILIEPFSSVDDNCITALRTLSAPARNTVHALVFSSQDAATPVGSRWIFDESMTPEAVPVPLHTEGCKRSRTGISAEFRLMSSVGEMEVFVEIVKPQIRCVVFGAGNDAVPLAKYASLLGWHITITDKSAIKAHRNRFPIADEVVCLPTEKIADIISSDMRTVCILASHNFSYDSEILPILLRFNPLYIGILGPRKRWEKLQREINNHGVELREQDMQRIFAPAGLDIGAETPEEIALSIVSEIQTILNNGSVMHLRDRKGPIHILDDADKPD